MEDYASKVEKLVALSSSPNANEAALARAKAVAAILKIDPKLLDTLARQREKLLADMRAELNRLFFKKGARPNAGTRDLLDRAWLLLGHYQKVDAMASVIKLLKDST